MGLLYTVAGASGRWGPGSPEQDRRLLRTLLDERRQDVGPFGEAVPAKDVADARWVAPELIGEVACREWIRLEHRLRHPSWQGLRRDVSPPAGDRVVRRAITPVTTCPRATLRLSRLLVYRPLWTGNQTRERPAKACPSA